MNKFVLLALCVVISASLGVIVGTDRGRTDTAWSAVSDDADELSRTSQLRDEVDRLRARFTDVKRDLDVASTPAAATAAREKLFQLRVDMVAVQDEIAVLAGRRPVAREF